MAKTNTTKQVSELIFECKEQNHTVTNTVETAEMNSYVRHLHETLDVYQLFDTFTAEFRAAVACDSVEYKDEATQTYFKNGIVAQQHYFYALRYEDQSLGSISITRDTALSDDEIATIEIMLSGLILPLRNALRYIQAIRFAQRDELTGLRNGSYYYDVVELEIKRAQRYKKPFSLLMFDIDNLDDINQQHGRGAGDALIIEVAKRIEKRARDSDIVYRSGGDKFLVFLPYTEKSRAIEAAEKIKDFVLSNKCVHEESVMPFTISAGVVTVTYADTAGKLLERASKSLFHAKILGKNRIYGELPAESMQARYL